MTVEQAFTKIQAFVTLAMRGAVNALICGRAPHAPLVTFYKKIHANPAVGLAM